MSDHQPPSGTNQPQYGVTPPAYGPPAYAQPVPAQSSSRATTALVLGILSLLCFGLLTGIPAMVVARRATREIDSSQGRLAGRGLATAGFVTGLIGTILGSIGLLFAVLTFALGSTVQSTFDETCTTVGSPGSSANC